VKRSSVYDDQWWIDHLENKIEVKADEEMERLLKNSEIDRARLAKLEKLRRLIKETDDSSLPEDGRFYDQLHDRIMRAVLNDDTFTTETVAPNLHLLPLNRRWQQES